ncbi:MAG: tRNA pseudouridine(38-40) synthase TruA [Thermodesulfobacteriota bacterium]
MRNIKLVLAYDGTDFCGWQRQNRERTVQGELEDRLTLMTKVPVTVHGAGRTDAGVHALAMVANFQTQANISCLAFKKGLNSLLTTDLRVVAVSEEDSNFHARCSAKAKTYRYHFSTAEMIMPHARRYRARVVGPLDIGAMEQCLAQLMGRHDFSSFEATGSRDLDYHGGRGAVRTIMAASVEQEDGDDYCLTIRGDGFLRKMVRNIAGTLFAVGRGQISVAGFKGLMAARDRSQAGATAPACGLFLVEIFY